MFNKLINWFKQPHTGLEAFVLSKRPTNAAEVEYWTMQYGYSQQRGYL